MDPLRQRGRVVKALGAMSGTSLDGVDAAIVETDGVSISAFGPTSYRAYTDEERSILRSALGQWEGRAVDAAEMSQAAGLRIQGHHPVQAVEPGVRIERHRRGGRHDQG